MQKVLLLILDGWGYSKKKEGNAIELAKTPFLDRLWTNNPHTLLDAAGTAVGLPPGYMGNSEVGHLTIGAGRILDTDLQKINKAIKNGSFYKNKALLTAVNHVKINKKKLHLMGLLSDAGVHSHLDHLFALLELAKKKNVKEVYVHAFLDGRDTAPKAAAKYIQQLQRKMKQLGVGTLATMMGRFYAMDRDNRWNREHQAYDCMVNRHGRIRDDALKAIKEAYAQGETDEFIKPTILLKRCVVDKDDAIIFFNFRSDRARELTRAFVQGRFNMFKRKKILGLKFVTLTQYDDDVNVPVAFPPVFLKNTLGETISQAGLRQLRIAETEKWAHVTYFFNGLSGRICSREQRIHLQSRLVTTYDKTPLMKVRQITDALLKNKNKFDFFVVNFANGDMVGHTGNIKAAVKAAEAVDQAVGKIIKHFPGIIFITADHGNCEEMLDQWQTTHTINRVPLIVVNKELKLKSGGLSNVAPTILKVMKIKKPKEMEKSLF